MNLDKYTLKIMLGERGISVADLSARTGISTQNLHRILRDGSTTAVTAGKIAKAIGCKLIELVERS